MLSPPDSFSNKDTKNAKKITLFCKTNNGKTCMVLVYVDELFTTGDDEDDTYPFMESLI